MVSVLELGSIGVLVGCLGLAIFYLVVAFQYRSVISSSTNTRGANVSGKNKNVGLVCDPGKVICVYRATEICSDPGKVVPGKNFENPTTDPISNGLDGGGKYGDYHSKNTYSLTKEISDVCNGKSSCTYLFKGGNVPCGGTSQLIASYDCVTPNTACSPAK